MDRCAVFLLLFALIASTWSQQKRYRDDYVFDAVTDGFYKLHIDGATFHVADSICKLEGAGLLVPNSIQYIAQVHGMLKQFPDLGDYVWIGDDGESHESAEEEPIINLQHPDTVSERIWLLQRHLVLTREGEIETYPKFYMSLPFVCYVAAKDAPYDADCDVFATGYRYWPSVGSCYRIPPTVLSWNAAYAECKAQGAHLVVLNSVAEREVVKEVIRAAPRQPGSKHSYYHIAGIRANRPTDGTSRVFRTIFNETLDEAGFNQWSWSEPNNLNGNEYCGSIMETDGKYNDQNCAHEYGFICEKEKRVAN